MGMQQMATMMAKMMMGGYGSKGDIKGYYKGLAKGMGKGDSKGDGKGMSKGGKEIRDGDWECPNCQDHNFGRNTECRRCGTPKPEGANMVPPHLSKRQSRPGDWHCPACNDLQFERNTECRKCGYPKPEELETLA